MGGGKLACEGGGGASLELLSRSPPSLAPVTGH